MGEPEEKEQVPPLRYPGFPVGVGGGGASSGGCSSPDPAIKEVIHLGGSSRAGSEGIMVGHTLMTDETGSPR